MLVEILEAIIQDKTILNDSNANERCKMAHIEWSAICKQFHSLWVTNNLEQPLYGLKGFLIESNRIPNSLDSISPARRGGDIDWLLVLDMIKEIQQRLVEQQQWLNGVRITRRPVNFDENSHRTMN